MIRNEFKNLDDYIQAIKTSGVMNVFFFEATAPEKGIPQARQMQNEAGLPGEMVVVETVKKTTSILLSAQETKAFEAAKETVFYFHEAQIMFAFIADEAEDKEYDEQKQAKITEIIRRIKDKCPEVGTIEGRTIPVKGD